MSKTMVRTIKGWYELKNEEEAKKLAEKGFVASHKKTYHVIVSNGIKAYAVRADDYAKYFH